MPHASTNTSHGSAETAAKKGAMSALVASLHIRRPEFVPSEIPIIAIPFLLTMNDASEFLQWPVLEGVLLFFLYFNFGDMINCLADRELDAQYKSRLSNAVYRLGTRNVTCQLVVSAILATLVAGHLAWSLDSWGIFGLHLVALFFAAQYSVDPLHLKSGGVWQVPCLGAILFFLPMTYLSWILADSLAWTHYALLFAYATMQIGIVLVNTAEDYMEDRAMNLRTSIIALGIPRSMLLVNAMLLVGAGGVVAIFAALFHQHGVSGAGYTALIVTCAAWLAIQQSTWRLYTRVRRAPLRDAADLVKQHGKMVPIWLTFMAWASFACALTVLLNK